MRAFGRERDRTDILVVCTGNVCRSPYLAARLRHDLPDLRIASAGTGALVGSPPTPAVVALLARRGVDGPQPAARALTRQLIRDTSLVLTAERLHRVAVERAVRGAAARTFTVRELARLLGPTTSGATGVDAVLDRARSALASGDTLDHDADDLADPYGLATADYERMARDADAALAVLVPALGGSLDGTPGCPV